MVVIVSPRASLEINHVLVITNTLDWLLNQPSSAGFMILSIIKKMVLKKFKVIALKMVI